MPGAIVQRHELGNRTGAIDQYMRRNFQSTQFRESRIGGAIESIAKQRLYITAAELPWRQTDIVDYEKIDRAAGRTLIVIGRGAMPDQHPAFAVNKPAFAID